MEKVDFNNTVFIIDSMITAMMVSIIASGNKVNCIIEHKIDVWNKKHFECMMNFANKSIDFSEKMEMLVPNCFFILNSNTINSLKNLINFRLKMNKVNIPDSKTYIGASTSSIIKSLRCSSDNIYYLDHGTGDYLNRNQKDQLDGNTKINIKKMIINKIIGLPNFLNENRQQGYTLCKMINDYFMWVDYRKFDSEEIERGLDNLIRITSSNDVTLYCAVSDIHKEDGLNNDTSIYDDVNLNMIKYNISLSETIFIKFHPTVYMLNNNIKISLLDKVRKIGYKAYDIAEFLPEHIGGVFLPIEVIMKYCCFNKIVAQESSVIWNLNHIDSVKKVIDNRFNKHFSKSNLIKSMLKKCKTTSIEANY